MMKSFLVCALLASFSAVALGTEGIGQCKDEAPSTFSDVKIFRGNGEECAAVPCELNRNENATLTFTLTNVLDEDATALRKEVLSYVPGLEFPVNFPLDGADKGCDDIQGETCPFLSGQTVSYAFSVVIPGFAPNVKGVELDVSIFSLADSTKTKIGCSSFTVDIVPN